MRQRKEKVREGLEIDFDLLDSDMVRWYIQTEPVWTDAPNPQLVWMDFVDQDGWTEGESPEPRVMIRTLDDERELAEGRRMFRLVRYKSYGCLADLAERPVEDGEFVIRMPPALGNPHYIYQLDEARLPPGLGDPDSVEFLNEDPGFVWTNDLAEAQRFSHAEAIRLTIRIMEVLGCDIPADRGAYHEPLRIDVAEELHARAKRRPRRGEALYDMLNDLSREP